LGLNRRQPTLAAKIAAEIADALGRAQRRNDPELQGSPLYSDQDAERILAAKYIVVSRIADYTPPKALDPDNLDAGFKGGHADLEISVVPLDSSQVIAAFNVSAASSKEVNVEYSKKEGSSEAETKMEQAVVRTIEGDAFDKVRQTLKDKLGCKID
jgi:hypothetical protein